LKRGAGLERLERGGEGGCQMVGKLCKAGPGRDLVEMVCLAWSDGRKPLEEEGRPAQTGGGKA